MPKSMHGVMSEYKHGELHSGSKHGPVVRSRKQAIAIGLSEQRQRGHSVKKPKTKVYGSGPFSKAEINQGYKVEYSANDLAKMDYEAHPAKKPMASRISPKDRGKCY